MINVEITLTTGEKIQFTNKKHTSVTDLIQEHLDYIDDNSFYQIEDGKDCIRVKNIIRWRQIDD